MKKVVEDFKDEIIEEEKKETPVPADVLRSLVEKSSPSTTANGGLNGSPCENMMETIEKQKNKSN